MSARYLTSMFPATKTFALLGAALCLCAVTVGVVALYAGPAPLDSRAQKQWQNQAIAEIASQSGDAAPILEEIAAMKVRTSVDSAWRRWISDDLIVMRNGEWMAYRNLGAKEQGRIHDLFIGRGCDGRWYYSTYDFSTGMGALKTNLGQPRNLSTFRADCLLHEFDGRSDKFLKRTWPLRH